MILGPPETPYQFAFFEFSFSFGNGYPANPPTVVAKTTNKGRCRFNPNIYASGRVCLSILGTWQSRRGEEWSSAQGLESTLLSIQSLMSNNPYKNEPGYEDRASDMDLQDMKNYVEKIQHESLRLAVIEPLESSFGMLGTAGDVSPMVEEEEEEEEEEEDLPIHDNSESTCDAFIDLRKRRLLWYFESYLQAIDTEGPKNPPQRWFKRMPFESPGNTMDGHFDYPELRRRLHVVKDKIMSETKEWVAEGLEAKKQELRIAVNLQHQYQQIVQDLKDQKNYSISLELANDNPFLWEVTYFGRPMSHLDGGIFRLKIYVSPRFPEEQPRVFMDPPVFHVRVSKEGVVCYIPHRADDMRHHIEAIVAAIDKESPPYDPRTTVNLEASKLFWGTPEDRKMYSRRLRQSIAMAWD
ncbi:ubiquitin-conjugating enzyme/RWD-like protein [Aspergillus ambiguus]|uniref:ubiquitin-conjugating enzyme E2 n=1 Tax=Aspergillus ambiguus TaxID=176160 RepID=UPI003CCDF707